MSTNEPAAAAAEAVLDAKAPSVPGAAPVRQTFDPVYEFDAPQFHDFTDARDDPIAAESYFHEEPDSCDDVVNTVSTDEGNPAPESKPEPTKMESNIFTNKVAFLPEATTSEPSKPFSKSSLPQPPSCPESPGLRVPSYSLLAPERLMAALSVSKGTESASSVLSDARPLAKPKTNIKLSKASNKTTALARSSSFPTGTLSQPSFSAQRQRRPPPKSSEEIELEKLRLEMKTAAQMRSRNKKRMMVGTAAAPESARQSRSRTKTTTPRNGFAGSTSDRSRSRSVASTKSEPAELEPNKRFQSLSGMNDRFFSSRSSINVSPSTPVRTTTRPFHLSTPRRQEGAAITSEEAELAKINSVKLFKARKIPRSVLQSVGDIGVPRVLKKSSTVPKEFSFSTSSKKRNVALSSDVEEFPQFRSRPVPKHRPSGTLLSKAVRPTTVPMSPRIAKPKPRPTQIPKAVEEPMLFQARPMPDFSRVPKLSAPTREHTVPAPFPLKTEERGASKRETFMAKLQAQAAKEEAARAYKAKPLVFTSPMRIAHSETPLTEPKPFALKSQELHEKMNAAFQEKVKAELDKENEQFAAFRASVPMHLTSEPFVPVPTDHEPVVPKPFHLASEERSKLREEFDRNFEAQQCEAKRAMEARKAQLQRLEQAALDEALDAASFKARPFRAPACFQVVKSVKVLTEPMSPQFATDMRKRFASANKKP